MVELCVIGISLQGEETVPVVLLYPRGSQQIVSLRISAMEAFAISTALHSEDGIAHSVGKSSMYGEVVGKKDEFALYPSPLVHDFLLNVIKSMEGRLLSINILSLVEGANVAEAVISLGKGKGDVRVDCRPADGIAIALRSGAIIRAGALALSGAKDLQTVLQGLPEHVRTIATARLNTLPMSGKVHSLELVPESVEMALTEKMRKLQGKSTEELISVARKMLRDEDVLDAPGLDDMEEIYEALEVKRKMAELIEAAKDDPELSAAIGAVEGTPKPQVKVISVRPQRGNAEILDESQLPGKGITEEILSGLGLTRSEADAVKGASTNDRWAMLLRILSPETKVPM